MARRATVPSITPFLPFSPDSPEPRAGGNEDSALYMHRETVAAAIQRFGDAYMSTETFTIGTQPAVETRDVAVIQPISPNSAALPVETTRSLAPIKTLTDLLMV